MSQKTWGGRFTGDTDKRVEAFTQSVSFDHRLYKQDIAGSIAHAEMLAEVGLLTAEEARQIRESLKEIEAQIDRGELPYRIELEDIHTHIERALIERLGDVGRKLHTGRSRNDQVATDLKLWTREAIHELSEKVTDLQRAFLEMAEQEHDLILPAYTHLQRAQPILAAHYCLAQMERLRRDHIRLVYCSLSGDALPLGAAALAGTSLPIDRERVAKKLRFTSIAANSLDAVSDRDFVLDFLYSLSMIALHLCGWAEEWILWSTTEFNLIELPDAFCTGSSIMPHKKNPDVLELIRGKTARVLGALQRLMVLVKGLPLAYNRDLQEDKEAVFDAFDTVNACLELAAPLVRQTTFRKEAIAARLEDGFLDATTLMEHLILQGVPMRSAHEAVGKLVRLCEERRCRLKDLPTEPFEAIRPGLTPGVYDILGAQNAVRAFRSAGSTAPAEVEKQLRAWRERLEKTGGV
jgi:argininosuccinate lyase